MTGSQTQPIILPSLTLVLGGARSGKSGLAERLVTGTGLKRHYIATAEAWDDEMRARIALHQAERGDGWITWNCPREVCQTLTAIPTGEIVLLDCATLWLSNHFLAEANVEVLTKDLLECLKDCASPVVIVSNEVGMGIVPENALAREFRDHQGRLNQRLAAQADLVVGVMAGLPVVLKGVLPAG